MFAAIASAVFLATLWMLGVVAFRTFAESGGKILAALKGRSILAAPPLDTRIAVRVSQRSRQQPALRARPQWRVAA